MGINLYQLAGKNFRELFIIVLAIFFLSLIGFMQGAWLNEYFKKNAASEAAQ
jgi:ABC-type phosphate transport system permease subunit